MAIRKKVQKVGGSSKAVLLGNDIADQMGVELGDTVVMEMVGDALVIRKDGTPAPDPTAILAALAVMSEAPPVQGIENLSERSQRILDTLDRQGPLTAPEISRYLNAEGSSVRSILRDNMRAGRVVREGRLYRLAADAPPVPERAGKRES